MKRKHSEPDSPKTTKKYKTPKPKKKKKKQKWNGENINTSTSFSKKERHKRHRRSRGYSQSHSSHDDTNGRRQIKRSQRNRTRSAVKDMQQRASAARRIRSTVAGIHKTSTNPVNRRTARACLAATAPRDLVPAYNPTQTRVPVPSRTLRQDLRLNKGH